MNWGHFLFGFSGRINRAKFWLWILLYIIAAIVVGGLIYAVNSSTVDAIAPAAFGLIAFITGLAVYTKRLHDRNKSAWWLLVFWVLPTALVLIGAAVAALSSDSDAGGNPSLAGAIIALVFIFVGFGLFVWAFVELACLRGTIGQNAYGPDPLENKL